MKTQGEALRWLDGSSWWWELGSPGKERKKWNNRKREFIHQEQTPKEGINHLDETRIRIMSCLSFTNLNWWQAMDLAYYLFS